MTPNAPTPDDTAREIIAEFVHEEGCTDGGLDQYIAADRLLRRLTAKGISLSGPGQDFADESETVRRNVMARIAHELDIDELELVAGAVHNHVQLVPEPLATTYRNIAVKIDQRISALHESAALAATEEHADAE